MVVWVCFIVIIIFSFDYGVVCFEWWVGVLLLLLFISGHHNTSLSVIKVDWTGVHGERVDEWLTSGWCVSELGGVIDLTRLLSRFWHRIGPRSLGDRLCFQAVSIKPTSLPVNRRRMSLGCGKAATRSRHLLPCLALKLPLYSPQWWCLFLVRKFCIWFLPTVFELSFLQSSQP